jgi:hypothetical protein
MPPSIGLKTSNAISGKSSGLRPPPSSTSESAFSLQPVPTKLMMARSTNPANTAFFVLIPDSSVHFSPDTIWPGVAVTPRLKKFRLTTDIRN